jgi:hypothetical protein
MGWDKKGLVFVPDGSFDWSISHAQLPIVDVENSGFWRIYYSTRNKFGQSSISYINVEPCNPQNILYIHPRPILALGKLGTFDESGLMAVALVNYKRWKYLFYAGWSLKKTVPYHNTIGLAISDDGGGSFTKYGEGPLFDSTPIEPYSNGTINILIEDEIWKAWYQSITKWTLVGNSAEPFYNIKYAESRDGISWNRKGFISIGYKDDNEAGICSASVIGEANDYRMWYCYRGTGNYRTDRRVSYRIGFARSQNGKDWTRKDEDAGIDISVEGWDSEMIAYPNVVSVNEDKYMFYNGNGFGRTGFGYAKLII